MNFSPARGIVLITFWALAGCSLDLFEKSKPFKYQDEVGIAKLSVISVAPWDKVREALQPNFKLQDADEALEKVGASVRSVDEAYSRSLNAALRLALPGAPDLKTGSDSAKDAGETPKTSGQASGSSPGQASTEPLQAMSASSQYRLASSLFQEIQLLNKHIEHVAQDKKADAYLISIDVALLPARRASVDAFVLIAFVGTPKAPIPPMKTGKAPEAPQEPGYWSPTVVPIILSEDIELNRHSRQVQNVANIALGLAAAIKGIGVTGELERTGRDLLKASGRDINTLQVVGSATPNALIVRFGAGYGIETDYALLPQTRRVHALLFVPDEQKGKQLFAISQTIFRHVDGREIPSRSQVEALQLNATDFLTHTGIKPSEEDLGRLWRHFHLGEMKEFEKYWTERNDCPQEKGKKEGSCLHVVPVAWATMSRLSLRSGWSYSQIPLPDLKTPPGEQVDLPGGTERYGAFDNGQVVQVRIPGEGLSAEPGRWQLKIKTGDGATVSLLPNAISRISDRTVELVFPSVTSFTPRSTSVAYKKTNGELVEIPLNYSKLLETPPTKSAIRVLSGEIAAEADGSGELAIEVLSHDVKSFAIEGTAALFTDSLGKAAAVIPFDKAKGRHTVLALRHLIPGRSVTIVARQGDDEAMARVSIPVIDGGRKQ